MELAGYAIYPHSEAEQVRPLVTRLADEYQLRLWFDEWDGVPGDSIQRQMAEGLSTVPGAVLFIGAEPLVRWVLEEIESAIQRRVDDPLFRIITVLLPRSREELIPTFQRSRLHIDLRNPTREAHEIYRLACGLRRQRPGRWPPVQPQGDNSAFLRAQKRIRQLRELQAAGAPPRVVAKYCDQVISAWMREGEDGYES